MGRNKQQEYWESLKRSFPPGYVEEARKRLPRAAPITAFDDDDHEIILPDGTHLREAQ